MNSENPQTTTSERRPVIYRPEDYVGLFRHSLIFVIDGLVVGFGVALILGFFAFLGGSNSEISGPIATILSVASAWWYLAVLKPSRFRTPGYWIADTKIETLYGLPPTPWKMTLRLMLIVGWLFGIPTDIVTDFIWTTMGDDRQMLRDLICETRLVRNKAKPIRFGRITYCLFTGLGRTLFYARVR